ncbi:MAG: hypothetical protein QNJ97_10685 [Myxococcota bacterium]|nr:hypothetical protein [Myxococcota bacterium]
MKKTLIGIMCLSFVTLCSSYSLAGGYRKQICARWPTEFTDTKVGEDIFPDEGPVDRRAAFASATMYWPWGTRWTGTLDEDGCTPKLRLYTEYDYELRVRTKIQHPSDSSIRIYVQDNSSPSVPGSAECNPSSSTGGYKWYDEEFIPTASIYKQYITMGSLSWDTNMAAIAGQVMRRHTEINLGLISNTYLFVYGGDEVEFDGRCGGSGSVDYYGIEIRNEGADRSRKKFQAVHEFGHAIGDAYADFYDIHSGSAYHDRPLLCYCTGTTHCLQSREYIAHAQSEGFAHFISSAVFNKRNTTDQNGFFGYYKPINYPPGRIDCTDDVCPVDLTQFERWWHTWCDTSWNDRGVEWDWLVFFWNLWTADDSSRYSITDILDVWERLISSYSHYSDWTWVNVVNAAIAEHGSTKGDFLKVMGENDAGLHN